MKVPTPRKLASGNWFIQLRLNGESISITSGDKKDCIKKAQLIKAEHLSGEKKKRCISDMTLKDACDDYIDSKRTRLSPTTIQGYEKIRDHNFQEIMDMPVKKITWDVLDRAIAVECGKTNGRGDKLSPKTIKNAFAFIISALKRQKMRYDEPFSLPEVKRKPVRIIPADEVHRVVMGTEIELPCLLAMWLTMSISEIRGLTKSKSIANGQITILETMVDVYGKPVLKEGGKEVERTRTQDIPPYIQTLIDNIDGDIICSLSAQAVNKRLQRLLEKNGLPVISFHKLRHISASTMAALGIPTNYAQEKGGWRTDHTMKTVYTHTFTEERKQADTKMDEYFSSIIKINANENANR